MQFPKDMLGKTIEIIAFELKDTNDPHPQSETEKKERIKKIEEITKDSLVDLSNFNFDRNEANNYE